ncbi:ShlB/FhaC/HecB family hemolysin secretion/activation protein [Sodalinema gerasimenkoae]|uniref:ShlB/FhaC/HecB family hemolysin secretion/activation protein n=1 Tax=Sodalinema gerasimenkoae TaxID=2862348 RepID=UPI001FE9E274|nr:ShlB/FhaC/HecB family hemolysin secretion/activation protein [Sodalinema gerasimenkoae]
MKLLCWFWLGWMGMAGIFAAGLGEGRAIAQPAPPQSPELPPLPDRLPPPSPEILVPPLGPPEDREGPSEAVGEIQVREIQVLGNTVFSAEELAPITEAYEGRSLVFEDLINLRTQITDLYVENGYTTSGAFIPPQDVTDGVVQVQVVEGRLDRLTIAGVSRLSEGYIRRRIGRAAEPPLSLPELERALQLLQQDPAIASVRAELVAGRAPGLSELRLNLTEASPFQGGLRLANRNSPNVGSIRPSAQLEFHSPLGIGDSLWGEFGITEGVREGGMEYQVPLNSQNTRLSLLYRRGRSRVVQRPFNVLGIRSTEENWQLGLSHPIWETPNDQFRLGLSLGIERSRTFISEDDPFSFSEGPQQGRSNLTVLQFTQEWSSRSPAEVVAARSQVSLGLDAFNATRNQDDPDGQFFAWLGQFQWVRSLSPDTLLITRVASQLSTDPLLPISQFGIGGPDTVRGYLQNQRVGDSGVIASVEFRYPLIQDPGGLGTLQIAPFLDVGTVWNLGGDREVPTPQTLVGTGVGLRWDVNPDLSATLDWGIPLVGVGDRGDSLQGNGIYFSIEYNLF